MAKRTVIVRDGLRYKKRTQVRSRGGHVPRFSRMVAEAGGKKTAHRYVRRRYKEERRVKLFRFKLMREDTANPDNHTLLTDIHDMRHSLVDSNGNWIWTDWEYNDKTEYWDLTFHDLNHRSGPWDNPSPDLDPNGYWIWYWSNITATYVINTQYPYKYKTADQQNNDDLIKPGTYDGLLPYWEVTSKKIFLDGIEDTSGDLRLDFVNNTKGSITVKSSVPYRIEFRADHFNYLSEKYESDAQPYCWCCPYEWRYAYGTHPVPWPWGNIPIDRKAVMVATNSEGDPEITDTDNEATTYHEFPANYQSIEAYWALLDVSSLSSDLTFNMPQPYTSHCEPESVNYAGTYLISTVGGTTRYPFHFVAKYEY